MGDVRVINPVRRLCLFINVSLSWEEQSPEVWVQMGPSVRSMGKRNIE